MSDFGMSRIVEQDEEALTRADMGPLKVFVEKAHIVLDYGEGCLLCLTACCCCCCYFVL